jgi:glycosyltransferase involved in cell wall biosynthesis
LKIIFVAAHINPKFGYQDFYLPLHVSRLGHKVRILTSNAIPISAKNVIKDKFKVGLSKIDNDNLEILRLDSFFELGGTVISRGVKNEVIKYDPDVVIILGLGKIFGIDLFTNSIYSKFKVVSFFGDNIDQRPNPNMIKNILSSQLKKITYRLALKYSHRFFLNLPETSQHVLKLVKPTFHNNFKSNSCFLPLGYSPDKYFFDKKIRNYSRKALNINEDDVVIVTSTRVSKEKNLKKYIDLVSGLSDNGYNVRYIIIGFFNDDYSNYLINYVNSLKNKEIFNCFPFSGDKFINEIYCASDIGIWTNCAISIQESMGTGLLLFLENKSSLNYLVEEKVNGFVWSEHSFDKEIVKLIKNRSFFNEFSRERRFQHNKTFSYDNLANAFIKNLKNLKIGLN